MGLEWVAVPTAREGLCGDIQGARNLCEGGQSHPVLKREVWAQEGADTRAPTCVPGGFSVGPQRPAAAGSCHP